MTGKFRIGVGLALALLGLTVLSTGASAQDRAVMIVVDRTDPSSIPEQSPIYQNALREIAARLAEEGLEARRGPSFSTRFDDALKAAQRSPVKISAVLAMKIYVSMHRRSKGNSFYIWIDGEVRDTVLGKVVATHKHRGRDRQEVEVSCGQDCMLATAEEAVSGPAAEFGEAVAEKLADALPR